MVNYRRNRIEGGTYFFTVTLQDRNSTLLRDHIDLLRLAFASTKKKRPFVVDAIVILPDHLHSIWTLPQGDGDYPARWRGIKALFTKGLISNGVTLQQNRRGEYGLWQKRYWEHTIRDTEDLQAHVDYIHFNPVKHGWVEHVKDWPYSSFHRYVNQGLLPEDWGAAADDSEGVFGE